MIAAKQVYRFAQQADPDDKLLGELLENFETLQEILQRGTPQEMTIFVVYLIERWEPSDLVRRRDNNRLLFYRAIREVVRGHGMASTIVLGGQFSDQSIVARIIALEPDSELVGGVHPPTYSPPPFEEYLEEKDETITEDGDGNPSDDFQSLNVGGGWGPAPMVWS